MLFGGVSQLRCLYSVETEECEVEVVDGHVRTYTALNVLCIIVLLTDQ